MATNGAAVDPTGPLLALAGRAAEAHAHELESVLSWHLARLRAASENARRELEAGVTARLERLTRAVAVPSTSRRQVHRVFERLQAQGRRTRAAVAAALAVAVFAGTGAFVATQAATGENRAQRSTSTSVARPPRSTAGTTPGGSEYVPATDVAPAPDAPPPSAVPATRAGAPATPGTSRAAATQVPGTAAAPAPGSTGAQPSSDSPPSSPRPRSPTCQLLPVVCP